MADHDPETLKRLVRERDETLNPTDKSICGDNCLVAEMKNRGFIRQPYLF